MAQDTYERNAPNSNIAKIVVDRELCIGAASCIAVAAETYEFDGENVVIVTDPNSVDDETLIMSAQSCPTKAILLFDKEGNQVYP